MRQHLANLFVVSALAGCSLIYNPGNLPPPPGEAGIDSPVDAEIILDADPAALTITKVTPAVLFEGQGDGGSRQAVIVVEGEHIVAGARITIAAHSGETLVPMFTIDEDATDIAANGRMIAVPVTLPVDTGLMAGQSIALDVTVTQDTPMGPVSKTLPQGEDPAVLTLQGFDELTEPIALDSGTYTYSQVELDGDTDIITGTPGGTEPVIIRSISSITAINDAAFVVDASGIDGGPAGGRGGNAGVTLGAGGTGGGPAGGGGGAGGVGGTAGGGGGFTDNCRITTHVPPPYRGSGGGGGGGGTLGPGGRGGGGGGTLELTAGGHIEIAGVSANGAGGAAGSGGGAVGGGGSGGVVLLRAGGTVSATGVTVAGVGAGAAGCVRFDAAEPTATVAGAGYRGPMFFADTPVITRNPSPPIKVTGEPGKPFQFYWDDETGATRRGPVDSAIGGQGQNTIDVAPQELFRGINTFCLVVEGGDVSAATPEARNCIKIVYLYTPQQ
jgi:hypothetical protein